MTVAAIARGVVTTALVIAALTALYIARDALLTIYIAGLLAIGIDQHQGPRFLRRRATGFHQSAVSQWLVSLQVC